MPKYQVNFRAFLKTPLSKFYADVTTFLKILDKFGLLFIPRSGHTGRCILFLSFREVACKSFCWTGYNYLVQLRWVVPCS